MKYRNIQKIAMLFLSFIIFSFVLCMQAVADEEFNIIIKKTCEVNVDNVYLRDIASIKAPSFLKSEIENIEIIHSPEPGKIKIVLKDRLVSKIYSNYLIDKSTIIISPDKIYIKRNAQKIDKAYIKENFLKYVETFQENNKFDLRDFKVRGMELYPLGKLSLLFDKDNKFKGKGRFSIRVEVLVDDNSVDILSLSGWIDVYEKFVCARVVLNKNCKIDSQDLYYKSVNTSKLRQNYAKNIKDVKGMLPKNTIKKGGLIKVNLLVQPPLVHKGETVRLVAKRKGLKIITAGISKEDGIIDDLIRVENLSSGKIVRGFVKEKSMVEVYN
jgi:flagella basal body P-ring formation protein FlgA